MLTALVMLFATSAFATEGDVVTIKVKAGFDKDFAGATQVSWEKNSDFYFANFMLNGVSTAAAYNEAGTLVGTAQTIKSSELPADISAAVKNQFGQYRLTSSATKLNFDGVTSYYVFVENDQQTLKLKCDSEGEISVEKETKK